jgi:hypothetical protein
MSSVSMPLQSSGTWTGVSVRKCRVAAGRWPVSRPTWTLPEVAELSVLHEAQMREHGSADFHQALNGF